MGVNYVRLREENKVRYGTDIWRIGGMLLANRYDKRTHFIFELLQNAEDALRRRKSWSGSRAVKFELQKSELRISHFGQPFDEADVRGICGIDESTKDITSIGRFGIGFKSVYAFTQHPEIHSGSEDFAIESYVWPVAASSVSRDPGETVIVLPLNKEDKQGCAELVEGLEHLGARALLFLRHVKELEWAVEGGPSGLYFRDDPKHLGVNVREIGVMGEQEGKATEEERWLVFSREVFHDGQPVGHAEIAFSLSVEPKANYAIQPLPESPLVVFFPTILQTNLGFLVQGPYRTTPSRDNIPANEQWNQDLVRLTSELIVEAMRWLVTSRRLNIGALQTLPLDRAKFAGGLLAPIFDAVAAALKAEPFLPTSRGGYTAAASARLSRTQELRDLFEPAQLGALLGEESEVNWLSGDITADRTPELRQYLMRELAVPELTPESLLPRLSRIFLEKQPDDWIIRLYGFLSNVPAIVPRLANVPLVRLERGRHVVAFANGLPQAFLPSKVATEFPTIQRTVCEQPDAKRFLQSLGLTEPDPVDDVIYNVLPKYCGEVPAPASYDDDISRMVHAFSTESRTQREKLTKALADAPFVMARDLGDDSVHIERPANLYLPTARLKELFSGIEDIRVVDDNYDRLRGEEVRELLEACGATRYIVPCEPETTLSETEKVELRQAAGYVRSTGDYALEDYDIAGLDPLLEQLPTLDHSARAKKAELLWEALIELLDRRQGVFSGTYRWHYFSIRSASFEPTFVRKLNSAAWVPNAVGELQPPSAVLFECLKWRANSFLQAKIHFKTPIVEELAREAGFEPEALDMLKKLGLTSVAELMARLKVDEQDEADDNPLDEPEPHRDEEEETPESDALGDSDGAEPDTDGEEESEEALSGGAGSQSSQESEGVGGSNSQARTTAAADNTAPGSKSRKSGERHFVSYVAVDADEEENDPDGLDQGARLVLEQKAVRLICGREPQLKVMPPGTKGFDLIEEDAVGDPERWVEVKAMAGSLEDRPVGLSQVQFEFARQHGEQYWLYIVEHAGDPAACRIVKIQDPARKAGTFTFDRGWKDIAEID
ncbi:sacsin N-terminal ATP-binding-like domain-containing protein [Pseudorhodoplanes sp.]|uniref:DUF3883 domain-containing protein n=1 Tax=Pseudorhodoplanes sp. TaxID=1934341 RepID=UPI003D0E6CCD